jgi:glutamate-1-semialdehyde 2,1-aminomutase/spore coat polysaccharide biosynthesis protein SpsF
MGSTRLPGKVLTELGRRPVLEWVVSAAQNIPGVNHVVVATSDVPESDPIVAWCEDNKISSFRGPENDVLARFAMVAKAQPADLFVRLTADCPLLDPHVCGEVLAVARATGADYTTNAEPSTWPDGLDCEVFTRQALHQADAEADRASDREHVTPYIRSNRSRFSVQNLVCPIPGLQDHRWTLDNQDDFDFLAALAEHLPNTRPPSYLEILDILERHPALMARSERARRNEGYRLSRANEGARPSADYVNSQRHLARAVKVIPLGAQTFSKSHIQFPQGASPLFLTHGDAGHVWDVDGNEYIDLVCGLLPVVLGYRDQDVDDAVRQQLNSGISFSLSTELEYELAERLTEIVPCAEMVRFGKNGTDATTGAIRVARAATGRDRVAVCGYHGWQDWYVGSISRNKGVPATVAALTHRVPYGDLDAVDQMLSRHRSEFAALIMEPMTTTAPEPGYLSALKALVHSHGALLIFDEIITGFRYALGGAQELFGVTPDLATFGKAMANGMPISALVGRADYMMEMEEVFYSGTFGGETLSLAAAIAVIDKMRSEPVIEYLWKTGDTLARKVEAVVSAHNLSHVFQLVGKPPWKILNILNQDTARKEAIKTLFLKHMLEQGILIQASHNLCYAHSDQDIEAIVAAYDVALGAVAGELAGGNLESHLECPVIEPVFQVR